MNKKIVHTVFEDRVVKTPNNLAIVYDDKRLTYQELNFKANGIGYALEGFVDEFVAIFLPNGIDYVQSILGVLKAGAIFVPMDTLAPIQRLNKIIKKAKVKKVITNKEYLEDLRSIIEELSLNIDILVIDNIEPNSTNLPLYSKEDSAAYLIFTSGSTGEPKAIVGMQKSLSHFVHWESKEFEVDDKFIISQLAGVTFDVSLRDIFVPLINGATICIPKQKDDMDYLANWVSDNRITLIHIVPSVFRLLVKTFEYQKIDLSHLKHILLAGEALYGEDILNFHRLYPHIELVNLYGPSETTLAKIYNRVKVENITNPTDIIPLGKPISNSSVLILKNDTLTQVGELGEIYIKTPFRSKGYLDDEELNRKVFIQNPLNNVEDIIYKTGDIGKYQEDGTVDFVGREDSQLKINGIRVELSEIEMVVKGYEGVQSAIVSHEVSNSKDIILVCYYIEKLSFEEDDIIDYLFDILPNYMIPSFFVKLEEFPLNAHGKVDRKALPKPERLIYIDGEFQKPQNKIEENITKVFSEVLNIDMVSRDISFIKLGGNSLNAISAIAKLNQYFHVKIDLKSFFENQTVEALAKVIQESNREEQSKIEPIKDSSDYALSNAQRRLWVLDTIEGGLNAYNMVGAIAFDDNIDENILKESLFLLISRHEVLRTNFVLIDKEPRQVIKEASAESSFETVVVEDIDKYMISESEHIFNLAEDALFYIKLINQKNILINMHHIISDGWSIGIIIKELSQIYTALSNSKIAKLPQLSIQYRDYAHWQNSMLKDESFLKSHQNYWHNMLREPVNTTFPLDYSRGTKQTFNGKNHHFRLDENLTQKIKLLSQESTLFITLFTITNILISKYTNQDELILGTPVANRAEESLLNQIGFYTNTLALKSTLNREKSFRENLKNIDKMCIESFSHQSYPFDKLVDELGLDRDMSQNPLFNIMMILQNNENIDIEFDNLQSRGRDITLNVSKFDMTLSFFEIDNQLELVIEYNTNLFKPSTIQRLSENLERLIESIELEKRLNELQFISDSQHTILNSFNSSKRDYPKEQTIIDIFETKVALYPDNIAIAFKDREVSYSELNIQANKIGHHLIDNYNITKEMIVPIILDKSPLMIKSLLGVLKSGGAYLPIDSEYPKDRIIYMLQDTNAKLVITDRANVSRVEEYCMDLDISVVCVEDIKGDKTDTPNIERNSTDLAYIIYTSGTTGHPKGVMVEHKSFVNMILYQIESFGISDSDRVIQFASFSFDASIYETFLTLLSGACYVLVDKDTLLDRFVEITKKYRVNTAVLNPTFLANIPPLENFKTIITAGEKAIVKDALRYAKRCNYINAYGPTEVSICSAFYKVDAQKEYKSIPIGRSIANLSNYILNNNLEQMPIGAVGEICTAGEGLARGYLNRDDLTNEKFIEHPEYGRIYKTGDIGRYNESGDIEYIGRVDNQVKIRGFRVELGEIENTILEYPFIKECVVILLNQQLIAYIVGEEKDLKAYLSQRLADYMIPNFIISLETLPLTPNGKIDTKALPIPEIKSKKRVVPESELEILLCDIYYSVLGIEVGLEDSFFDFGGDSIKAIQISSRLSEAGYKIEVKELFSYPKIKELIPFVRKNTKEISQDEVVGSIKSSPIQEWFWTLDVDDKSQFNQDLLLEIDVDINKDRLESMLQRLLSHHDILRATYKNQKQYNKSTKDTKLVIKYYKIKNQEEIKQITSKLSKSFELSLSPLIKFAYIKSNDKNYLYIVAHHLVVDGVSWRILMEDLSRLYNGDKLLPKTNSFMEYSDSLRSYKKESKEQIKFWKKSSQNFKLKTDNKIKKRVKRNQKSLTFELDKKSTVDILKNINFAYNTTTEDMLILALNMALYDTFGIEQSVIGLESHGRDESLDVDLSRTVGWFTALYPLALAYKDRDLSMEIKKQKEALREIPNKGIGYGVLKYLAKEDLNFSKEILFNYLGQFEDTKESIFNMSTIETGATLSDDFIVEFKLDISIIIINKSLHFSIAYDKDEYKKKTIQKFMDSYKESLSQIINHCLNQKNTELTPDDIDDDEFDIEALSGFLEGLELE